MVGEGKSSFAANSSSLGRESEIDVSLGSKVIPQDGKRYQNLGEPEDGVYDTLCSIEMVRIWSHVCLRLPPLDRTRLPRHAITYHALQAPP